MEHSHQNFLINLERKMLEKRLSQSELAHKMKMPRGNVSLYASGKQVPSLKVIDRFAMGLGTTAAELLRAPGEPAQAPHDLTECLRRVNAAVEKSQREPSIDEVFSLIEAMVEGSDTDGEGEKLEQLFQDFGQLLGKKKTG